MNIANGGTLHQDLEQRGFAGHRAYPGSLGESTYHAIDIQPTRAARRPDRHPPGELHHHQGIDLVAKGAAVTAFAIADGLPEALEWPALRSPWGFSGIPRQCRSTTPSARWSAQPGPNSRRKAA